MGDLLDLNELDRLCKAATPGPWFEGGPYPVSTVCFEIDAGVAPSLIDPIGEPPHWEAVCFIEHFDPSFGAIGSLAPSERALRDRAYIAAANPEAVGRLIAALRAAVNRLKRYEDECDVAREIGIDPASVEERP